MPLLFHTSNFNLLYKIISILVLFGCSNGSTAHTKKSSSSKFIQDKINLGGLFSLHYLDKGKCSATSYLSGVRGLMAMLYAVDRINTNKRILPNVTLGVHVFDTCSKVNVALSRVLKEFVMGECSVSHNNSEIQNSVVGVIGPETSRESVHVAKVLGIFKIPLITYIATSSELSDKTKYEYFSRTVPSDILQVKAIVELLVYFNWSYVSIVYSDESYGSSGFEALQQEFNKHGICLAVEGKVPAKYDKAKYIDVIDKLIQKDSPDVVVLFCVKETLNPLFHEMRKNVAHFQKVKFVSSESLIGSNLKEQVRVTPGLLYTMPSYKTVNEFENYLLNLNAVNNKWETWFKDFYEQVMNCSFDGNRSPLHGNNVCNSSETLRSKRKILGDISNGDDRVIDGVYAFAHSLHEILEKHCQNGLNCKPPGQVSGELLLHTLRNISFKSPTGRIVRFNKNGDVDGEYTIYYLQRDANETFKHIKVGQWNGHGLRINATFLSRKFRSEKSRCSESCSWHEIEVAISGKPSCCWICQDCPVDTIAINNTCQACEKGFMLNRYMHDCIKIEPIYYTVGGSISPSLVIPPLVLSILGIFAVVFIVFVLIRYNNTPLVKASGRELSYLLLIGIFLSYMFPFVSILKPTAFKCLSQFLLDSLPMTISFGAIAVKTYRVFRIFSEERIITTPLYFARPLSQIFLAIGLICIQVILLLSILLVDLPRDKLTYISSKKVHLVCTRSDIQIFFSHFYNFILVIACTYYGYKARNIPRNFNETKHIAFAMYGSCVMVVTFLVVFAVTEKRFDKIHKLAIHCYRVTLIPTVLLLCFFAPKVYTILLKPEENVKSPTFKDKAETSLEETQNTVECRQFKRRGTGDGPGPSIGSQTHQFKKKEFVKVEEVERCNRSTQTE